MRVIVNRRTCDDDDAGVGVTHAPDPRTGVDRFAVSGRH
jgi:hypothetical protein